MTVASPLGVDRTLALPLLGVRLIEASAGTGKTHTIGNLYLRYVVEGYPVDAILVVTFTNAATEELRGRLRQRLHGALNALRRLDDESVDPFLAALVDRLRATHRHSEAIERLTLAVRSMDRAAIHTIHGFCQRALTDQAFHSGQPFELELVSSDETLWLAALRDWWRLTCYPLEQAALQQLLDAVGDFTTFAALQEPLRERPLEQLIPRAEQALATLLTEPSGQLPLLRQLADEWRQQHVFIIDTLGESPVLQRRKEGYYGSGLKERLATLDSWFSSADLLAVPDCFAMLASATLHAQSKPSRSGQDERFDAPFFRRCQQLIDHRERLRLKLRSAALHEATRQARQRVGQAKEQAQSIAFHDLLERLDQALQGTGGKALADSLRTSYPVALIDEFQDTDALQYRIFRTLYLDQPECGLTLIGDPKQAIYSFRGGDIFTYLEAKQDAGEQRYTLQTNWRSVPLLVEAVNRLFSHRDAPFIYHEVIDYLPVTAASDTQLGKPHALFRESGRAQPPLTLWRLPPNDKGKALGKGEADSRVAAATAAEIARLLAGSATLGDQPLRAGDIAVLVRTAYEGRKVRDQLLRLGIATVTVGRESVYHSGEALALLPLLAAVVQPLDRRLARAALGSPLLGLDYRRIADTLDDTLAWSGWSDQLLRLHQTWLKRGFMAMFQQLLSALGIGMEIAASPLADRRLTNLLHLAELLQQASKRHPGIDALLGWYRRQLIEGEEEEALLRLESDAGLVRISTLHASKGLEYPVVFLPTLWNCRRRGDDNTLLRFHHPRHGTRLDAGSEQLPAHRLLAEKERLAEDLRLAYVALTRASAKVYLAWGRVKRRSDDLTGGSALAYLLHPRQTPDQLDLEIPAALGEDRDLEGEISALAASAPDCIDWRPLPEAVPPKPIRAPDNAPPPGAAQLTRSIASDWQIASFSSLTREVHQLPHGGAGRAGHDPILDFPAGSEVGSFLHLLLEQLDFTGEIAAQCDRLLPLLAPRFGLDPLQHRATLVSWLNHILRAALDGDRLRLCDLAAGQRLNELAFDFATGPVDIDRLNRLLERHAGQPLPPLQVERFRGMVTGIIDLVFRYNDRYYIVDYKSNFLGGELDDYTPQRLRQAVLDRRYDLQYLLYSVALHRYLGQRLPGYDPQRHFGGAYYLFLRGLRQPRGNRFGVFHDRPADALIESLDRVLFARGAPP